jgi:hypothetical protein
VAVISLDDLDAEQLAAVRAVRGPVPRRRAAPRHHRHRHRLLLRLGVRAAGSARVLLPSRAGRHARPAGVAHRHHRRLPTPRRRRPRQRSTRPGSARIGPTSCGSSPPSTPAPFPPTTWCGCCNATGTPLRWARRSLTTGESSSVALHRLHRRRDLPPRHQGHPQSARRPPRPGPEDLHGKKDELYQRYHKGMDDQPERSAWSSTVSLLWNTFYIGVTLSLDQLRAAGYPVRDEDIARRPRSCRNT